MPRGSVPLVALVAVLFMACSRRSEPTGMQPRPSASAVSDAGSPDAAAPVDYGNPVRDADFEWGTYVFPSSHRCLQSRPESKPPDLSRDAGRVQPYERVEHAFEEAKHGRVVRVVFKAHGAG